MRCGVLCCAMLPCPVLCAPGCSALPGGPPSDQRLPARLQWVEGQRLRTAYEATGGDASIASSEGDLRLVEVGVECSLRQMLEVG